METIIPTLLVATATYNVGGLREERMGEHWKNALAELEAYWATWQSPGPKGFKARVCLWLLLMGLGLQRGELETWANFRRQLRQGVYGEVGFWLGALLHEETEQVFLILRLCRLAQKTPPRSSRSLAEHAQRLQDPLLEELVREATTREEQRALSYLLAYFETEASPSEPTLLFLVVR